LTLPWTADLALLASSLDDDHRGVLDKLNDLLIALRSTDQTGILMSFTALTAEARAHFAVEEARMREVGYPELDRHCEQHERLLRGLAELRYTASAAQNFPLSIDPLVFLERWFVPHLKHDDRQLADFLAARETEPAD
jgi:hemerythrin-like metal-binding protein